MRPPLYRLTALAIALGVSFAAPSSGWAAPSDPSAGALPARDTQAPEAATTGGGTASVSEQTGAATYALPIALPPGRRGMAPSLELSYSSQNPLRGGIAVGWTLSMSTIELDPDVLDGSAYRTGFGRSQRLLFEADNGQAARYRGELDGSFTRYQLAHQTQVWTAWPTDGSEHTFGQRDAWGTRWYLTRHRDADGNEIHYRYETINSRGYDETRLSGIQYTSNPDAGLDHHASVELKYAADPDGGSCGGTPVAAATDHRFGAYRMTGAAALEAIVVSVRDTAGGAWRTAQRYLFGYDQDELGCDASGLRYLDDVTVVAYDPAGTPTIAPPITFEYGPAHRILDKPIKAGEFGGGERGSAAGPQTTLMDFDGDGWVDRLEMETAAKCTLAVYRGLGVGSFEPAPTRIELPTAAWFGGLMPGGGEWCTLSGQTTWRGIEETTAACYVEAVSVSYHLIDWDSDGLTDVITNLYATNDELAGGDFTSQWTGWIAHEDNDPTPGGPCPTGTVSGFDGGCFCTNGVQHVEGTGCLTVSCPPGEQYNQANQRCECGYDCGEDPGGGWGDPGGGGGGGGGGGVGEEPEACHVHPPSPERIDMQTYVWRVQHNLGGGAIEPWADALLVHSPAPLPPNPMPSTVGVAVRPGVPTLLDINGDGYLDLLSLLADPGFNVEAYDMPGSEPFLFVWPGDGGGYFGAQEAWSLTMWAQRFQVMGGSPKAGYLDVPGTISFLDLNNDGLPDIVAERDDGLPHGELLVGWNHGGGFGKMEQLEIAGPVDETRLEFPPQAEMPEYLMDGARGRIRAMVDVDADGYLEHLVILPDAGVVAPAPARVAFRLRGGRFEDVLVLGAEWEAFESVVRARAGRWYRHSDALDVTGDGLPDMVTWTPRWAGAGGEALIWTDPEGAPPLRLLTKIDNGRGAQTRIEYAPITRADVVDLGAGHLGHRSLVARVITAPGSAQPELVTSYRYADPHHGWDSPRDRGAPGFLGFAKVTIDRSSQAGPDGARTIKEYEYPQTGRDLGGRLVGEWKLVGDNGAHTPVSHVAHEWQNQGVGEASSFTHEAQRIVRTCAAGQSMGACLATPDATVTTTETWKAYLGAGSKPHLYLHVETRSVDDQGRPRYQARGYQLRDSATSVRVMLSQVDHGGTGLMTRELTFYDAAERPYETWRFQAANRIAITRRGFLPTGLVAWEQRPRQVAGETDGVLAETVYDAHQLFPWISTNARDQTVIETRDVATGALLRRQGPHQRAGMWETEEWRIDGFGRLLERRLTTDPDPDGPPGTTYTMRTAETIAYHDTVPGRVVRSAVQDFASGAVIVDETVHDGLGRVIRAIGRRQDGGTEAVTGYTYDAGGALAAMDVPDPRVDDGSTVRHTWVRDGIGRLTHLARPDNSGEKLSYHGPEVEVLEQSPQGTHTRLSHDAWGDLVAVNERSGGDDAITTYAYDALGRMETIVDAEGAVTSFGHDWHGNRTSITRGTRTWTYGYDLEDNMVTEVSPVPVGGLAGDYTATTIYDVIGRPTDRLPATRGRSVVEQARLGIGPITYEYDAVVDGELSKITLPFGEIEYVHDGLRRLARETRRLTATGQHEQSVERTYDALGAPRQVRWDDGTTWRYHHDARGMVEIVEWLDPTIGSWKTLASYQRSVAGAPRLRSSGYGQHRAWRYDERGRPTYDRIWRPGAGRKPSQTYAERTYGYAGDELDAVWGHNGGLLADATYVYDDRHRVTDAVGPLDYTADLTYTPTGNIDTARIAGALDSQARHVQYRYADFDPQAVEALEDLTGGGDLVTIRYDLQGNVVERVTAGAGQPLQLSWDGDDLLRESNGPGGTERYLFGPGGERMAAIGPHGTRLWFAESETHIDAGGRVAKRWHHVATGEPVARIEQGTRVELQYADVLQNLMLAIGSDRVVRASFLYGAFGELVAATGDEDHRRQFNGKENDQVSGLRHYGFRSYDQLLLRWVSADPLYRFAPDSAWAEPQRANLYAFSLNNPLRWMDPDGLDGDEADGAENADAANSCPHEADSCSAEDAGEQGSDDVTVDVDTEPTPPSDQGVQLHGSLLRTKGWAGIGQGGRTGEVTIGLAGVHTDDGTDITLWKLSLGVSGKNASNRLTPLEGLWRIAGDDDLNARVGFELFQGDLTTGALRPVVAKVQGNLRVGFVSARAEATFGPAIGRGRVGLFTAKLQVSLEDGRSWKASAVNALLNFNPALGYPAGVALDYFQTNAQHPVSNYLP